MKLPKNLIFPAQQLPLERDGVQPYPSKSSSWGSVACLRSPFYCPSLSLGLSSPLVEVFVFLINTEQNHMWAGLHYAIWEDGLLAGLQLVKVFLFGHISRGDVELHCISFLIDIGCLKFTSNAGTGFILLKELYSLKFLDQHEPASANSCFTSNY